MLNFTELLIIAVIILLLFGSRFSNVSRSLGQGIRAFKKGLNPKLPGDDSQDEPQKSASPISQDSQESGNVSRAPDQKLTVRFETKPTALPEKVSERVTEKVTEKQS
jgi:sec-independent protein translocase protein TatA